MHLYTTDRRVLKPGEKDHNLENNNFLSSETIFFFSAFGNWSLENRTKHHVCDSQLLHISDVLPVSEGFYQHKTSPLMPSPPNLTPAAT